MATTGGTLAWTAEESPKAHGLHKKGKGQSKGNFLPEAFQTQADGTIVYDNNETQELLKSTLLILTVQPQIDGAITTLDEVHRVFGCCHNHHECRQASSISNIGSTSIQHAPATPAVTARSTGTSVRTPMSTPQRTTSQGSVDEVSNQDHKRSALASTRTRPSSRPCRMRTTSPGASMKSSRLLAEACKISLPTSQGQEQHSQPSFHGCC